MPPASSVSRRKDGKPTPGCAPPGSDPRRPQPAGRAPPRRGGWRVPGRSAAPAPDLSSAEDRPRRGRRGEVSPAASGARTIRRHPHPRSTHLVLLGKPGKQPVPAGAAPLSRPFASRRPGAGTPRSWAAGPGPAGPGPGERLAGGSEDTGVGTPSFGSPPLGESRWPSGQEDQDGGPRPGKGASRQPRPHPGGESRENPGARAATPATPLRSAPGAGVRTRGPHLPGRPRPTHAGRPAPSARVPRELPASGLRPGP